MKRMGRTTVISSVITFCLALLLSFTWAGLVFGAQGTGHPTVGKEQAPPATESISPNALAPIMNAHIYECIGGQTGSNYMKLRWSYGAGKKPDTIKINVQKEGEQQSVLVGGVVEVSGTETTKEVRVWKIFNVHYILTFEAAYSSSVHMKTYTKTYTFTKKCEE
jgi:hypothetical protein